MSPILSLFLGYIYIYMCVLSRIKRSPTVGETKDLGNELAEKNRNPVPMASEIQQPGG